MLKQIGFAALGLVLISASSPVCAQQAEKPAASTRGIVVEGNNPTLAPPPPAVALPSEGKVVAKPAAPSVPVPKPADAAPPPVVEKQPPAEKPPVVVKKPVLKEKPVVRAKPPHRPRYGYGGYY
jgi:translation initiation factor IF-2